MDTERVTATDLSIGSFSDAGPWVVDPAAMPWRSTVDEIRLRTRAEVPSLTKPPKVPPIARAARVGRLLVGALLMWALRERRKGDSASRAGIARRLRRAFEKLGSTYIKLGQIISSGEGVFPEELVAEFKLCRDEVPAESFKTVRRVVEADLGRKLEEVFSYFAQTPIAAASIAQVHAATLRTGEEVVVKVQRPKVSRLVRKDLRAMSWIAPRLIGRIPVAALANPPALVELFAQTIVEELDFRIEAQNMLDIARVLAETDQRALLVPRPHPELVTPRVLVMERLSGFSWDDAQGMKAAGVDTSAVLRAGMVSFLEGAMLYGVFHGDLHGGNLFVQPDGKVVLLDFGITGRLDEQRRQAFIRLMMGATGNNIRMQIEAFRDLGALPPDTDIDEVIRELGLDKPFTRPGELSAEQITQQIRDAVKALLGMGARMPKDLILFVKNMLFLDGAIATLAPELDLISEIFQLATYFATKHGERLAREAGVEGQRFEVDLVGMKQAMGFDADVESFTYKDIQKERALIRARMEKHRKENRRGLLGRRRRRDPASVEKKAG
jgi:ubiquinone biosynthesis protein